MSIKFAVFLTLLTKKNTEKISSPRPVILNKVLPLSLALMAKASHLVQARTSLAQNRHRKNTYCRCSAVHLHSSLEFYSKILYKQFSVFYLYHHFSHLSIKILNFFTFLQKWATDSRPCYYLIGSFAGFPCPLGYFLSVLFIFFIIIIFLSNSSSI